MNEPDAMIRSHTNGYWPGTSAGDNLGWQGEVWDIYHHTSILCHIASWQGSCHSVISLLYSVFLFLEIICLHIMACIDIINNHHRLPFTVSLAIPLAHDTNSVM